MRCILIMSSKVMGCFASWAAISNPHARISAMRAPLRREMPFILFSPENANVKPCGLRMMSRFRRESNSAVASPKPIDECESGGGRDHEEFSVMHPSDKHDSNNKRQRGNKNPAGKAKRIGPWMLLAEDGQGRGYG